MSLRENIEKKYEDTPTFKIGEVSTRAKVNKETVRYYEKRNLIPEPDRRRSGYRIFTQRHIDQIKFIKRAGDILIARFFIPQKSLDDVADIIQKQKKSKVKLVYSTVVNHQQSIYKRSAYETFIHYHHRTYFNLTANLFHIRTGPRTKEN